MLTVLQALAACPRCSAHSWLAAHHSGNKAVLLLSVIITVTPAVPCLSSWSVKLFCYNDKLVKWHSQGPRCTLQSVEGDGCLIDAGSWPVIPLAICAFLETALPSLWYLSHIIHNSMNSWPPYIHFNVFFFADSRCFPPQSALLKIPKASRRTGKDGGCAPAHEGGFISPKVTCPCLFCSFF